MFGSRKTITNSQMDTQIVQSKYAAVIDVGNLIGTSLSLDEILQKSVDIIVNKLKYDSAVVFLYNDKAQKIYSKTFTNKAINNLLTKRLIGGSFDSLNVSIAEKSNFIVRTFLDKEIKESENLADFIVPTITSNVANILQNLSRTKRIVSLPLIYRTDCLGVIMFTKLKDESFSSDFDLLKIYSSQVAIAIFNAQSFEEKNNQLHTIRLKANELASLYNLTSQISKSLDPDVVSQTAVDSLPQDQMMIGGILTDYDSLEGSITVKALTRNRISDAARNLLGDFKKYETFVKDPAAVGTPTVKAILSGEPQFSNDLINAFSPPIPKTLITPLLRIINVKSIAVYPVFSRGRIVGTIGYLIKDKGSEELEENQKQLLQTYTTQIGIALENARLFTEVERVKNNLEIALSELQIARERERDMIDIMGHELRTPMSIVRNALGMMELHLKKEGSIPLDKQQKYVDAAIESAKREINLIETLLSATKADSKGFQLAIEKVDLLDVINDSLEALKGQAIKRGLEIKYQKPEKDVFVYCDRTRIQEVADNFIGNAIKYTPKGFVEISVEVKDNFGWVHVRDSGIGIDEQDLKKLGRKFFRAKQYTGDPGDPASIVRPGGTGLGLYVSFNLIRIMEGILDVQSKVGEGSVFSFGMPLYTNQKPVQVERKVAPEQTSIESLRKY